MWLDWSFHRQTDQSNSSVALSTLTVSAFSGSFNYFSFMYLDSLLPTSATTGAVLFSLGNVYLHLIPVTIAASCFIETSCFHLSTALQQLVVHLVPLSYLKHLGRHFSLARKFNNSLINGTWYFLGSNPFLGASGCFSSSLWPYAIYSVQPCWYNTSNCNALKILHFTVILRFDSRCSHSQYPTISELINHHGLTTIELFQDTQILVLLACLNKLQTR